MFAGETSIGKLVARRSARTEAVLSRLRLSHLLSNADFTPPGFPPHAILIVRHAAGPRPVNLAASSLNSKWEAAVRENITRLYRGAERPAQGIFRAGAQAVLFADFGEWLACLGLAAQRGVIAQTWYWRASLQQEGPLSSFTLARVWTRAPRFVPAAIAHLAHLGRAAEVLKLFSPRESNEVFTALAVEWGLSKVAAHPEASDFDEPIAKDEWPGNPVLTTAIKPQYNSEPQGQSAKRSRKNDGLISSSRVNQGRGATLPPWNRWTPALEKSCAELPVETQLLLATGIALFHAPALARSPSFADEVNRWLLATREIREGPEKKPQQIKTEGRESYQAVRNQASPLTTKLLPSVTPLKRVQISSAVESDVVSEVERVTPGETRGVAELVSPTRQSDRGALTAEPVEVEPARFWRGLSGSSTKIGGLLFLLNLLQQTELPESFDEDLNLSQHISGWGLVELLGKALLAPLGETFPDDPLWSILASLDGRAPGEVPAASLPAMPAYRMPAVWLKRFVSLDEPWVVTSTPNRFRLWHRSGKFAVVDCPLDSLNMAEQANSELERYRAQGISPRLEQKRSRQRQSASSSSPVLTQIPGWSELPRGLREWMRRTFPFLHYLLVRALRDDVAGPEDLARVLLLKTGSVYSTATHIDLVMPMDQIAVAVRQTGLDANPGWLRDLRRVVSFHFE
jgi:hypothetical protein